MNKPCQRLWWFVFPFYMALQDMSTVYKAGTTCPCLLKHDQTTTGRPTKTCHTIGWKGCSATQKNIFGAGRNTWEMTICRMTQTPFLLFLLFVLLLLLLLFLLLLLVLHFFLSPKPCHNFFMELWDFFLFRQKLNNCFIWQEDVNGYPSWTVFPRSTQAPRP